MTGNEFAAAGHALALAYARLRGAGWPSTTATRRPTMITTTADAIAAMIELYATPGTWRREGGAWNAAGEPVPADSAEAVAWSLEGALYRVIGDPFEAGIGPAEADRRLALEGAVMDACGMDLCMFGDAARNQGAVAALLRGAA